MSETVLHVEDLAYAHPGGRQVLFGVSLTVHRGERVALVGPNGAGKTTFVLHLNAILRGGRGRIEVAGLEVAEPNLRDIRRRVGIVFQDPDDQLFMPTVRDDVAFGPANLGLRGDALQQRVTDALQQVGMAGAEDQPPHHLSAGERRRVALATVLAMQPDLLVLDEPSAHLDPAARRDLAEVLGALDLTLLMVTHDLPYAAEVCDRAALLDGGVIVADGPIRDVLGDRELLDAHRLALPRGFDPALLA